MTLDGASSNLILLLKWYGVAGLLQLAALPLTAAAFPRLPDGGFSVTKMAGILLTGFAAWTAWAGGLIVNDRAGFWLCLVLLGVLSWGVQFRKGWPEAVVRIRKNLGLVLACELVFLGGFLAMAAVRAVSPQVRHTEQPMDLMVINSLWTSPAYPPHDAWLSGYSIGYYYFGYWVQVVIARLAGVPPDVAYNLGLATLFGFLATALFGLGFNLVRSSPSGSRRPGMSAWAGGFLAVLLTAVAGNLRSVYDLLVHSPRIADWWWLSSRAIRDLSADGTSRSLITEFPSFSYLLGDNHPHLHSSPLLLLAAAVGMNRLFATQNRGKRVQLPDQGPETIAGKTGTFMFALLFPAFIVAAVAATNSWDAPAALALVCLPAWISREGAVRSRLIRLVGHTSGVAALAVLMLFPFLRTVQGRVFGFLPNLFNPSNLLEFLSAMGPGFPAVGLLLFAVYRRRVKTWPAICVALLLGVALVGGAALLAGFTTDATEWTRWLSSVGLGTSTPAWFLGVRRWATQPFVAVALLAALSVIAAGGFTGRLTVTNAGLAMSLLLVLTALCLLVVPEALFVHDIFGYRVNTVFKWHYGAWVLLGPAGAYALVRLTQIRRYRPHMAALLAVLGATLLYPLFAFVPMTGDEVPGPWTLSTSARLRVDNPPLFETLQWIAHQTPISAIVLEAPGRAVEPLSNPISTFTGRATLLGWADHETQWRPPSFDRIIQRRNQDIEAIYRTRSPERLTELVTRHHIDFVVLGPRERLHFGAPTDSAALGRTGRVAFDNGTFRVYATRDLKGDATR